MRSRYAFGVVRSQTYVDVEGAGSFAAFWRVRDVRAFRAVASDDDVHAQSVRRAAFLRFEIVMARAPRG